MAVWELKPESCVSGPKRAAAIQQLKAYVARARLTSANWHVGHSDVLFPEGPIERSGEAYNGSEITVEFYPDPNPSSGLVFYKILEASPNYAEKLGRELQRDCACQGQGGIVPWWITILVH